MKVKGVFRNADVVREFPSGAVIFEEGSEGEEMFGILEGDVEFRVHGTVVRKLGPEETFGELAIIDSTTRSATAIAVSDVKLAVIDRKTFLFLVHETPMFALQVMSSIAERLRANDEEVR
jgi:CRP/FNR family cyclic AMP-dependent transcriptional regulator